LDYHKSAMIIRLCQLEGTMYDPVSYSRTKRRLTNVCKLSNKKWAWI